MASSLNLPADDPLPTTVRAEKLPAPGDFRLTPTPTETIFCRRAGPDLAS